MITKEDISLPKPHAGQLAYILHNVLTPQECQQYIDKTEAMGYEEALSTTGYNKEMFVRDVKKSRRCIWISEEEAGKLWEIVKGWIPPLFNHRRAVGLNERLRFLRYTPGEYFKPHCDGSYLRVNGDRSDITLLFYLNDGCKGGNTTFLSSFDKSAEKVEVVPKLGSVLVFEHLILHEASELTEGVKYCIQTDVMYRIRL